MIQVGGSDIKARKEKGLKDPHVGWSSLYGEHPAWDVTFEVKPRTAGIVRNPCSILLPMVTVRCLKSTLTFRHQRAWRSTWCFRTGRTGLYWQPVRSVAAEFPGGRFAGELILLRKQGRMPFEPEFYKGMKDLFLE